MSSACTCSARPGRVGAAKPLSLNVQNWSKRSGRRTGSGIGASPRAAPATSGLRGTGASKASPPFCEIPSRCTKTTLPKRVSPAQGPDPPRARGRHAGGTSRRAPIRSASPKRAAVTARRGGTVPSAPARRRGHDESGGVSPTRRSAHGSVGERCRGSETRAPVSRRMAMMTTSAGGSILPRRLNSAHSPTCCSRR